MSVPRPWWQRGALRGKVQRVKKPLLFRELRHVERSERRAKQMRLLQRRQPTKVEPTPVASIVEERPFIFVVDGGTTAGNTATTMIRLSAPRTTHENCEQFACAMGRVLGGRHYAMTQALYQGM